MIVDVGTGRDVGWYQPLAVVAGRRASQQKLEMARGATNLATRFDISVSRIARFVDNWAAPLADSETTIPATRNLTYCNCRAGLAIGPSSPDPDSLSTDITVLNLNDLLDITANTNVTELVLPGTTAESWELSGRHGYLVCTSCRGSFEAFVFDEHPSAFMGFRGTNFTQFEKSFLLPEWSECIEMFERSTKLEVDDLSAAVNSLTQDLLDTDPTFGRGWSPVNFGLADFEWAVERWQDVGADKELAVMSVLMEALAYQIPDCYTPDQWSIDVMSDSSKRREVVLRANALIGKMPRGGAFTWRSDADSKTRFRYILNLVDNDIDSSLGESLRFGAL